MISVIIATYNRHEDLQKTLDCLLKQQSDGSFDHEIIIIDNNSKDKTKLVVESLAPCFQGRLKYLFEGQQGKPYAINQGIAQAKGEIIVLTDDDCILPDDYLAQIYKTFQDNPHVDFLGGRIDPHWVNCTKPEWFDDLQPEWFKESFWGPLAILDYGDKPFILDHRQVESIEKKLFYGANMAVRRELFLKHGHFDVEKPVGEDTEFQLRFLKAKAQGLYAPHIKVSHKVTAGRLKPEYYYRWYYSRGYYREILNKYQRKFYHPLGIQNGLIIKTMGLLIKSMTARSHTEKMHQRFEVLFNLGQMVQIAKKNIM